MLKLRIILLYDWIYYVIFLIAIGYFLLFTNLVKKESIYEGHENSFQGKVIDYRIDGDYLTIDLKSGELIKVSYYFSNLEEKNYFFKNLKYGITLEVNGNLEKPINNTIPNTFNYKKYLEHKQIFWLLKTNQIKIVDNEINIFYSIKNYIKNRFNKAPKTLGYLNTFILGDKSDLSSRVYDDYQKNGVSHLFAISGTQLILFAVLLKKCLNKTKLSENKKYLLILAFLMFYVFLTNQPGAILRAATFWAFLELNKIYYTHIKNINLLLFVGALLIFINPYIIYDIGFQYSYATSFGLILASDKLKGKNYLKTAILVSVIAFLFSIPITLNNFYELNLLSIFNNLLFVPLVSVIYPISLVVFIFPFLDSLFNILIIIMEFINAKLASITIFTIIMPKLSLMLSLIFYCFLILAIKNNKKLYQLTIFASLLINKLKSNWDSNGYAYFLDVGQGDSIIIRSPYNKEVIMIDTGGRLSFQKESWQMRNNTSNISENTLVFMKSIGISKIKYLILTHGDEDHIGEALNIINNFKIDNIVINKGKINRNEQKIIDIFSNVNSEIKDSYLPLSILNNQTFDEENDDSIVLLTKIYNFKILLTGDASIKTEKSILQNFKEKIDLLKIGHHGSKTSSSPEFLKNTEPKYGIISSGRNNRYNHPSKEVIEKLEAFNITNYNTQNKGTITLKISSNAHTFSFNPP